MNINYKSDFDFILEIDTCIKQEDGTCLKTPLGWPTFDWIATFWTNNKANTYTASRHGDQLANCFNDNGQIHVVCKHHHLGPGTLNVEFHALLPDTIYPDGIRNTYEPQPLDIQLVTGPGDCPTTLQAELLLPMLKGEPFTFEDFTPEQIAEFQKPATDAAKLADKATTEAEAATQEALAASTSADESAIRANQAATNAQTAAELAQAAATNANYVADGLASEIVTKQGKLSTTDDLSLSDTNVLSLTERAKQRLFDDMWVSAVGSYGTVDHTHEENGVKRPYYLNELWLTYKEAISILQAYNGLLKENRTNLGDTYLRTFIPMRYAFSGVATIPTIDNCQFENVRFFDIMSKRQSCNIPTTAIFQRCPKIKKWLDVISWFGSNNNNTKTITLTTNSFLGDLQYFRFKDTNCNIDARYYRNIGIDSWQYLVTNRLALSNSAANPFTVTVHADVYAKLTGDTTNAVAAALREAEDEQWQMLLVDAAEKDITFTTP